MKNKKIIPYIICFSLIIVLASSCLMVFGSKDLNKKEIAEKYISLNEDEILERISSYDFYEICDEINMLSKDCVDISDLMYHSVALTEKSENMPAKELINIIADKNSSNNLKIICLQLIDYNEININQSDKKILIDLMLNENENVLVRQNIVWILPSDEDTIESLVNAFEKSPDDLAFQALKRLNTIDSKLTVNIAKEAIDTNVSEAKIRAAIKIITADLSKSDNDKEKSDWVLFLTSLLNESSTSKENDLVETIIFALSDLKYYKSIYEIINSLKIEKDYKAFCIDQNKQVLENILKNDPTDTDIETIKKAMSICPIDEINSLLIKVCS